MAGEAAEAFGNGLLVADIGEHIGEQGELGLGAGDGKSGVRHKREQAGGFESDRFTASVRAADEQATALLGEFEAERDYWLTLLAENGFEQRMARLAQQQAIGEARNHGVVIERESGFRENAIELGKSIDAGRDRR